MNVMNANGNGERHKRCSRNGPSAQHLGFWFQFGADGGSATAGADGETELLKARSRRKSGGCSWEATQ